MKKGLLIFSITLVLLMSGFSLAAILPTSGTYTCNGASPYPCVCNHNPDSKLGFGLVIIGPNYVTCDNIKDGICPEDFQDNTQAPPLTASCASCPDPDCIGAIQGNVYDVNGVSHPIYAANVTSHPIKLNPAATLENSTNTNFAGSYALGAITGTYYFSASEEGYDTQLLEAKVNRTGPATVLNFNLQNGTCHPDCTNSYNRCNKACDGVTVNGGTCQFYNNTVKDLCDNRLAGTEVNLGQNSSDPTQGVFIQCCGDTTSARVPYEKYYTTANTDTSNIKNLVKVEKIAKYNDVPVRIIVAYWQQ